MTLGVFVATAITIDYALFGTGFFQRSFPVTGKLRFGVAEARLALAEKRRPELVFLGNSRSINGFRPALFEQELAGLNRKGFSCNLGMYDTYPSTWYLFAKTLLGRPAGERVKALVLGLSPEDFDAPVGWAYAYDLRALDYGLEDFPVSRVGIGDAADMAVGRYWELWRHRKLIKAPLFGALRALVSGRAAEDGKTDRQGGPTLPLDQADRDQGFVPTVARASLLETRSAWSCSAEQNAINAYYLNRLLALCDARGIKVFVVWLPEFWQLRDPKRHPHMGPALGQLAHDPRVGRTVDLSRLRLPSRYWHDHAHLTPEGAAILTRELTASLQEPLAHALQ